MTALADCFNAFISDKAASYLYLYEYRMSLSTYPEWVTADHGQEIPLMIGEQVDSAFSGGSFQLLVNILCLYFSTEDVFFSGEPFLDRFPDVWTSEDKDMSAVIMSLWASFARTGCVTKQKDTWQLKLYNTNWKFSMIVWKNRTTIAEENK